MKKLSVICLTLILALIFTFCTAVAEEAAAPATEQEPMIDLTELIISIVGMVFSLLLAWLVKAVIPPLKSWLAAKTTAEQRSLLYQIVQNLVNAAEQLMGRGKGCEKIDYVIAALEEKGFEVDLNMIESAVKEMNDKAMARALAALSAKPAERSDKEDSLGPATAMAGE